MQAALVRIAGPGPAAGTAAESSPASPGKDGPERRENPKIRWNHKAFHQLSARRLLIAAASHASIPPR